MYRIMSEENIDVQQQVSKKMEINGVHYTRREIESRVGNLYQIGGTRHVEFTEGRAKGVRGIEVRSGAGLDFTIVTDRGLDIADFSYKGINLVYLTPNGITVPGFYDPKGTGWFKTFFGGLASTCGLTYFGAPGSDNGEDLGLHGRYSVLPAEKVVDISRWEGDDYVIEITGITKESELFSHKLSLKRTVTLTLGTRKILITDEVRNDGFEKSPFSIAYHMNVGFPLLTKESQLSLTSQSITPYTKVAKRGISACKQFSDPIHGFEEQDFLHEMKADREGYGHACFYNKRIGNGLGLLISFSLDTLPYLSEWKMMGESDYAVGLEPTNTMILDRGTLREQGLLQFLEPGETRTMKTFISVLDGDKEIDETIAMIDKICNNSAQ